MDKACSIAYRGYAFFPALLVSFCDGDGRGWFARGFTFQGPFDGDGMVRAVRAERKKVPTGRCGGRFCLGR